MEEWLPEIFTLPNGLRLVYLHSHSAVSHLGVNILAGSRFEEDHEEGLAHFLEHCIFKGTRKRKTFHVLSRLDSVGGELNAFTAKEEMVVYGSFTNNHLERATELLADITLNANFPSKEIEREKEIVLDEINSYLDSPSDKIFDDFEAHLFGKHPLGTNILGTKESVAGFSKADLENYLKKHFYAENMVISFVGKESPESFVRLMTKYFGNCPQSSDKKELNAFSKENSFHIRSSEANYQVHAVVGGYAPGYLEEDRKGMLLLTNILGGPALNSRLNLSVREKYGYSYNIEASYTPYSETGYWHVYFGTDPKYLEKTRKVLYKEIASLRDKKLGDQQLKMAKEQFKGHLALGMESNSGLMLSLGKSVLLFNKVDSVAKMNASIEELTAADLQRIANKYMSEKQLSELIFEIGD
jgi:predicted Zn-dependent peptidase